MNTEEQKLYTLLTTPKPPYIAIITTKIRNEIMCETYHEIMEKFEERVTSFHGYLGMECTEEKLTDGRILGVSAIYWKTLEDLKLWSEDKEHIRAKKLGKEQWYTEHNVRICSVLSQYGEHLN